MYKHTQIPLFDVERKIQNYKLSLTLGFYSPKDIVPKDFILQKIVELEKPIRLIKNLAKQKRPRISEVASILHQEPAIVDVVNLILALTPRMGFRDGRKITVDKIKDKKDYTDLAKLIEEIGFWKLISSSKSSIEDLLQIAIIHSRSSNRKFQAIHNIEGEMRKIIEDSLAAVKEQIGIDLQIDDNKKNKFSFKTRRSVDYVIKSGENLIAAIDVLFTTNPGGTQVFDLKSNYPNLQAELDSIPMKLIVIADGPGMSRIPDSALEEMFRNVFSVVSIKQAEAGMLTQALTEAATGKQNRVEPLDRIIESILLTGDSVSTNDLPKTRNDPRLTLAQYVTANPDLDVILSPGGKSLKWKKTNMVKLGITIKDTYNTKGSLELFSKLIGGNLTGTRSFGTGLRSHLSLVSSTILPVNTLVISCDSGIESLNYHELARESLQTVPEAKLMFLLVPNKSIIPNLPDKNIQSTLPTNIIVLDVDNLLRIAQSKRPTLDSLISIVLEQSDLTKISPFVVNSATPRRMYFGREKEEATLLSTLTSNSMALLGSRKIGKTSLLRNARENLEKVGFKTYFLDCQTVNNWTAFGEMAHRYWDIDLPSTFEPRHLFDLVKNLKKRDDGDVIILLDEIDQLLKWDTSHKEAQVPEAFFKACRTISQNGEAQFVFSGERTISERIWDPHSPHWNFCKSLQLRQLENKAAHDLIVQPLRALQIQIENSQEFANRVWELTSGHPQIIQYLGDKLVNALNQQHATDRTYLSISHINQIAETLDFQENYVSTYWGQATDQERLISLLIVNGLNQPSKILEAFRKKRFEISESVVTEALRILELYGIVDVDGNKYKMRAIWFADALSGYGDLDATIERYWKKLK
jgi:hypothetical protein